MPQKLIAERIVSVQWVDPEQGTCRIIDTDGFALYAPSNVANRAYREVLRWIADFGGTILAYSPTG